MWESLFALGGVILGIGLSSVLFFLYWRRGSRRNPERWKKKMTHRGADWYLFSKTEKESEAFDPGHANTTWLNESQRTEVVYLPDRKIVRTIWVLTKWHRRMRWPAEVHGKDGEYDFDLVETVDGQRVGPERSDGTYEIVPAPSEDVVMALPPVSS